MSESTLLNNRYVLEERIGSGGMAMVFRARDQMLERTVAIKTMRKDFSNDPEFRERFSHEAKAAAKLSHPNIVTVHDFGLDSGRLFIVMEYIPGFDLKRLLKQRGRFTSDETIQLLTQACAGIGYAHRAGLVHCDVKPLNILVTPDKLLKVADFGIARALSTIEPDEKEKVVWGSPNYLSPEQASGSAPSPASDVYALGVIMYEMMTGQLPFKASTSQELARLHREALPISPRSLDPNITIPLERMIMKALSKDVSHRYQTAGQMGRALVDIGKNNSKAAAESLFQPGVTATKTPQITSHTGQMPETGSHLTLDRSASAGSVANRSSISASPRKSKNRIDDLLEVDWIIWVLVILALIAVGGLIPFWLWVYYTLNPPV
jgi:serine/threonine-protein kinase